MRKDILNEAQEARERVTAFFKKEGVIKKSKTAHDLIMELYHARQCANDAWKHRREVNESEWQRLNHEARGTLGPINGGPRVCDGDQYRTPESKRAHETFTELSHIAGAAMRAVMKYGRENS